LEIQVDGWGRDKFMQASMLKDPDIGFWMDDAVIFKVEICVYGDLEEAKFGNTLDMTNQEAKLLSITSAVRSLYNNPASYDVEIFVGPQNERFFAHKCILSARSEMFEAMFSCKMREACTGEITFAEHDPEVFKALLLFLYTDDLPNQIFLEEHGSSLLTMAVKFHIIAVVIFCEEFYCNSVQIDNAVQTLILADNAGAATLKNKVLLYIAQNSNVVLQSKDFQELQEELLVETTNFIDLMQKKRGCRGQLDKEKKTQMNCRIM
jgi:speckle-type POZ protein